MAKAISNFLYTKLPHTTDDAFRAGLRKLGPKNNIPEIMLLLNEPSQTFYEPNLTKIYLIQRFY